MQNFTYLLVTVCCLSFFLCTNPLDPDSHILFKFPLTTGNTWRYLSTEEKIFSSGPDTVKTNDTLILTVKDSVQGIWRAVEFLYITKTQRDSSIVWFANADSGLIATDYTILAGRMPLMRSNAAGPNDTVLLAPGDSSHHTWTYKNKRFTLGNDTALTLNGNLSVCSKIHCYINNTLVSTLFYNSLGFIRKSI
jgi:hypothetical protein